MTYNQCLHLMFSIECFYDAHPEYFADLTDEDRMALSKVFLYDYDDTHDNDDGYPKSYHDYFMNNVQDDQRLQERALNAWAKIYHNSGMGDEFSLDDVPKTAP